MTQIQFESQTNRESSLIFKLYSSGIDCINYMKNVFFLKALRVVSLFLSFDR